MKISNHIHLLKIPFKIPLTPEILIDRFVNIYIIEGKYITLVDTGVAGSETIIYDYLKSIGRKPEEIKWVLLTHTHPDHIGALKPIVDRTGCKVAVHKAEKNWLEDVELQFKERPVPGFHTLVSGSCKANILVNDGDELDIDEKLLVKAIHCPGHSAGSVAYLFQQDNALIVGDAVPVKGDIPIYDDYQTSIKTLEKLENLPYADYLLSAWDDPRHGEEVELAISNGFEVLYAVHLAWYEVHNNYSNLQELTKAVLEKMGLPTKFINPLFARAIKSHS